MPRPAIGEHAMTDAERQARYRAARSAGVPAMRTRRAVDRRSRTQRWRDAVETVTALQGEYAAWLEALPDNLRGGTMAEALQAMCDLDLTELQAAEPPRGFGRD
jgi:hypothetical protein